MTDENRRCTVRPVELAVKPLHNPHAVQNDNLASLLGRTVRCRLLDGKVISGTLVRFDTFTLQLNGSPTLLMYKQAIAYVAPEIVGEASK